MDDDATHADDGVTGRSDFQLVRSLLEDSAWNASDQRDVRVPPRDLAALLVADGLDAHATRERTLGDLARKVEMHLRDEMGWMSIRGRPRKLLEPFTHMDGRTMRTCRGVYLLDEVGGRIVRMGGPWGDGDHSDQGRILERRARLLLEEALRRGGAHFDAIAFDSKHVSVSGVADGSTARTIRIEHHGMPGMMDPGFVVADMVGTVKTMHGWAVDIEKTAATVKDYARRHARATLTVESVRLAHVIPYDPDSPDWSIYIVKPEDGACADDIRHKIGAWEIRCRVVGDDLAPADMRRLVHAGRVTRDDPPSTLLQPMLDMIDKMAKSAHANATIARRGGCAVDSVLLNALAGRDPAAVLDAVMNDVHLHDERYARQAPIMGRASMPDDLPEAIQDLDVRRGRLQGRMDLSKGISWNRGRLTMRGVSLPETALQAMIGMPVTRVVDHPWLDERLIVKAARRTRNGAHSLVVSTVGIPFDR